MNVKTVQQQQQQQTRLGSGVSKEQLLPTACKAKRRSTVDFEWRVVLPQHPIPPFALTAHPLVVIIGWINCRPRHLEKYAKLYRNNGFCTMAFVPSSILHFFFQKFNTLAMNFLDFLMDEVERVPRPIIIQVFSGNLVFLSYVYQMLRHDDKYKPLIPFIKGQVFDSCPSEISERTASSSLLQTAKSRVTKSAIRGVCRTYARVVDVPKLNKDFWARLSDCPILSPQLFIYATDDPITSYRDVEKGIEIMRQQGIPTTVIQFDHSKHVNHYKVHPMRYLKSLATFWESVLRNQPNQQQKSRFDLTHLISLVSKF
eukprot:gene4383-5128_t